MRRLLLTLVFPSMLLACGQGEGERCQVDGDCSSGLICHGAKKVCTDPATGGDVDSGLVAEDAPPPPDADFDSTEPDAALDAASDAASDSSDDASEPDASDASSDA